MSIPEQTEPPIPEQTEPLQARDLIAILSKKNTWYGESKCIDE